MNIFIISTNETWTSWRWSELHVKGLSILDTPAYTLPLVLSLITIYGFSSIPAFQKSATLLKWKKHWVHLKIFAPFIVPPGKTAIRSYTVNLSIVTLCTVASRITNFAVPVLLRRIIDNLTDPSLPLPLTEIIIFVTLRQVLAETIQNLQWTLLLRVEDDMSDRIVCHLYNKLLTLSADYHDTKRPPNVYQTVGGSGPRLARFVGSLVFDKIPSLLDLVIAIAAFWNIFGGRLAAATAAIAMIYVWVSNRWAPLRLQEFEKAMKLRRTRDEIGGDALANWHTVALFNNVDYEKARFATAMKESRQHGEQFMFMRQLMSSRKELIMAFGLLIVSLLAGYQIKNAERSVGDFVMLLQFWNDLAFPIRNLMFWITWLDDFFSESDRMIDILKAEPSVKDKEDAADLKMDKGDIEFENIGFSYDGKRQAVQGVSFKIQGGQTVAIVGETGGGKSTLLKLLCRTYDATTGTVKIDGQDIRDIRLTTLMENISTVSQIIGVFNATILENLKYGAHNATKEECEAACTAAALHKKITSFPNGYEEKIGEKGTKLSGGELQRLAIARVLVRNSKIVLFDEAMSSLDSETEWNIQERLRTWCADKTVIIVAHRLATIAHADLILAVKDGNIVESGRHESLLEMKGYYYQLWDKQKLV